MTKMQAVEKTKKIEAYSDEIQNYDAKIAYEKWKNLGSKSK
jgi:hypothetical protein